ncbi:DNA polymerase III, delta prime subunit [Desulfurobacterium thermolithotrophum DSM 11699]|uniref:DNA polymerase III, delta prime subunit n=1 Tax=Desulfurobacterium thermolithotrophum (strain DSM 11699 / BSA) TaxID=868864 RepID=F0S422_DESTD|nr:AAA family ATPase [Desulfurobacterium thermolithotrophum]ADY73594.1 DNA polymerase III, delta prime subunit [Desulfurobacterium thermolithotrophum DSM 11699]
MPFSNIVGHSKQISILKSLIAAERFPQSSLFVGSEGIGKKLIAIEVLKLLTESPLNVRILGEEKAATIEEIREVSEWLFKKPSSGKGKGLVIDNAEEMRSEAANALLKTLEEPPNYGFIILITKNEEAILPTLRSRCKVFRFGKLSDSNIEYILEKLGLKVDKRVIKLSNGSVGMAVKLSETPIPDLIKEFINLMKSKDKLKGILLFSSKFSKLSREETLLFLNALENLLSQKDTILKWFEAIQKGREFLKFYGKPQSVIEWILLEVLLKTGRESF